MTRRLDELEDFKIAIDLRAFAAHAFAYELDPRGSSPNSALMHGPSGDKIIIARGRDGHHVYFSVSWMVEAHRPLAPPLEKPVKSAFFSSKPQSPSRLRCAKAAFPRASVRT